MNAVKKEAAGKSYAVPAVDNMLDLAEFLVNKTRPFGVSELSRELNISNNFVFRIMKRLVERGYAEFDSESGGYRLGSGFFSLGMRLANGFDLRLQAREVLTGLSRTTSETAQLQIPDGATMRILDTVSTQTDFFLQVVPGFQVPYHCNAFGKCVLAFLPEEQLAQILKQPLLKRTAHTQTDPLRLRQELFEVREQGIAYDREEHTLGVFCVGAPVLDLNGAAIGGLGVSGLAGKHRERQGLALEQSVFAAAAELAAKTGYVGDYYRERQAAFA